MTQSTCVGGEGGMTVSLTKPDCVATAAPMRCCHLANASSLPGETRVCVTMVTALAVFRRAHEPSLSKMRSGDSGRLGKRTPVALATALTIAGATQLMAHSPCALAPSGPILS